MIALVYFFQLHRYVSPNIGGVQDDIKTHGIQLYQHQQLHSYLQLETLDIM